MASLTGQTIASTYDALLKITDNGPITASLKRITDGLGTGTPLYLSATTVFVDGNFRAGGAFYDGNNEAGNAGQFLVSTGTGVDWQDISESNLISGTGTASFLSKFTSAGEIADSIVSESVDGIGIGIVATEKLHVDGNGLFTGSLTASNFTGSSSGANTGDETKGSIESKLGAASTINDGYLTHVDYESFVNKVPQARTITINGDTQDLTANRTFNVNVGVTSFNTRTGAVVLSSSDVTTALNYTPANSSRILTINGVGYNLSADRSWNVGTVTSVNTSAPLTGGPITSSGTIGITKADASTNGYLSSTDWNTFNNKQNALGYTAENTANKGAINGYASLDGTGKVPSTQLPSYVDDVVEVANFAALPATGETGKIYITLDTNFVYRWSGSVYVKISEPNATWGSITGTLSNQTDLQSALDAKVSNTRTLTINGNTSDLSADRTFNVGTVTSVGLTLGTTGTDANISGSPVTSNGSITLNLPTASASNRGLLSSTDWTTFNNKQNALTNPVTGTGTTNTLPKFTGASTIGNSSISDTGSLITLANSTNISNSGGLGIAQTSLTGYNIRVSRQLTGATTASSVAIDGFVDSTVTTSANGFFASIPVSGAFTLPSLAYFRASGAGVFSGASITNQYGFTTGGGLVNATNNYAFHSSLASGTGRWNLYMEGTARNYLAGNLNIASTTDIGYNFYVNGTTYLASFLNIGTTFALTSSSGFNPFLRVGGSGAGFHFQNPDNSVSSPNLTLSKTRSGTAGTYTSPVLSGDGLGFIAGEGADGVSALRRAVSIQLSADGNFSDTSSPGRITFNTTPANSVTTVERLRIDSTGGVGVGATSINASAILQINSTTRGFLPPRMTSAQRTAIASPAVGLMVYQTDATEGLYIYKSTGWTFVI